MTNLAARVCAEAEGGQILVSQRVYGAVEDLVEAEPVPPLTLGGFQRPIPAYVITNTRAETSGDLAPRT